MGFFDQERPDKDDLDGTDPLNRQALLAQMVGGPARGLSPENIAATGAARGARPIGGMGTAMDQAQVPDAPGPPTIDAGGIQPSQGPDRSGWQTKGYATPGYTAATPGGVPAGWDGVKWADQNHQTPKYVVGRIMTEADQKTPEGRAQTIQRIQQAYPGTTFNGKDKVTIPGVGTVDIFGNASGGEYRPAWQPQDDAAGGGGMSARIGGPVQDFGPSSGGGTFTPTDPAAHQGLLQRLQEILGGAGSSAVDRQALLAQMMR